MYAFTYHRPATVRQAASLLAKHEEAKLLAGGHTLIPTMKLRLAGPPQIIDMSKIEGLTGIEVKGRSVIIGAMTPHAEVATSPLVQQAIPALAALAGRIGDPAVRHRGTIGGSVANNDPNADYPAGCLGLGATIVTNKRRIQGDGPDAEEGVLSEVSQSGLALRPGRRVRVQAQLGDSRGGDRRGRQRRVPRHRLRGSAQEALAPQ